MKGQRKLPKHLGGILLLLVLMAVTFYLVFRDLDMTKLWNTMLGANGWYLLGGFIMILLFLCGEGQCYRVMLRSLGETSSKRSAFAYACADFTVSAITPSATGGQPAVVFYMNKKGVPIAKGSLILLLYTVIYKAVLITYGLLALCFYPELILEGEWYFIALFLLGLVINLTVMTLFVLAMFSGHRIQRIGDRCIRLGHRLHLVRNPEKKMDSLAHAIQDYRSSADYIRRHPLIPLKVYGWAMLQRLAMFSVGYWVYLSLGGEAQSFPYFIAVLVVLAFAVDSLPLPGAVGASEFVMAALYGAIYPKGMQEPAMLLTRGLNYYGCLILCGVVTILYHQYVVRHPLKKTGVAA